jgi:hypothetical protein
MTMQAARVCLSPADVKAVVRVLTYLAAHINNPTVVRLPPGSRLELRARWVTLRARWVTLRARWVTL